MVSSIASLQSSVREELSPLVLPAQTLDSRDLCILISQVLIIFAVVQTFLLSIQAILNVAGAVDFARGPKWKFEPQFEALTLQNGGSKVPRRWAGTDNRHEQVGLGSCQDFSTVDGRDRAGVCNCSHALAQLCQTTSEQGQFWWQ